MDVNTRTAEIKAQIWIPGSKPLFDYLYESKDEIESELGFEMNWERLDGKKASYISIIKDMDILDEANWDESVKWHLNTASILYDVFSDRIKKFK